MQRRPLYKGDVIAAILIILMLVLSLFQMGLPVTSPPDATSADRKFDSP